MEKSKGLHSLLGELSTELQCKGVLFSHKYRSVPYKGLRAEAIMVALCSDVTEKFVVSI